MAAKSKPISGNLKKVMAVKGRVTAGSRVIKPGDKAKNSFSMRSEEEIQPDSNHVDPTQLQKNESGSNEVDSVIHSKIQPDLLSNQNSEIASFESGLNIENKQHQNPLLQSVIEIQPDLLLPEYGESKKNQPDLILPPNDSNEQIQPDLIDIACDLTTEIQPDSTSFQSGSNDETQPGLIGNSSTTEIKSGSNKIKSGSNSQIKSGSNRKSNPIENDNETVQRVRLLGKVMKNELRVLLYLRALVTPSRGLETSPCSRAEISAAIGISKDSVKTAIAQSLDKQLLARSESQPGKTGWSCYRFAKDAYEYFGQKNKPDLNHQIQSGSISPSSSSSFYKDLNSNPKTTTTDFAWIDEIDIPARAGQFLNHKHLLQLARYYAKHEITGANLKDDLQESVDNFDLCLHAGHEHHYRNGPLNAFLGVMRTQGAFNPPENLRFNPKLAKEILEKSRLEKVEAIREQVRREMVEETKSSPAEKNHSLDDIPF